LFQHLNGRTVGAIRQQRHSPERPGSPLAARRTPCESCG
jgi:hypothetical protein